MTRLHTAILISGRGSNMVSIIKAAQAGTYPCKIALVISNRPDAAGLKKAQDLGVRTVAIDHKAYKSRRAFERVMQDELIKSGIEMIACAGFMRVLTEKFVKAWQGRMINIHPSLLPKYKGLNTHARAIEAGDAQAGCTVHWVAPEVDGGDIIAQQAVDILPGDTPETLAARILPIEQALYPDALKLAAQSILERKHLIKADCD